MRHRAGQRSLCRVSVRTRYAGALAEHIWERVSGLGGARNVERTVTAAGISTRPLRHEQSGGLRHIGGLWHGRWRSHDLQSL
jgi:hypothetical protein